MVGDVCRQLGVSEASFYVWKKKYGKLGLTELKELRQLRDENARLKRGGGGPDAGQAHPRRGGAKKSSEAGQAQLTIRFAPCMLRSRESRRA